MQALPVFVGGAQIMQQFIIAVLAAYRSKRLPDRALSPGGVYYYM